MGRLRNRNLLSPDQVRKRLQPLEGTFFDGIGRMLGKLVEGSRGADGTWNSDESQAALRHVGRLVDRLPSEQGTRFIFDTLMIQSFAETWGHSENRLSGVIVPSYGREWHLDRQPLYPGEQPDQIHMLEFLVIRGENRVSDMDLTEYGWMVHELAHSFLYKNSATAIRAMTERLQTPLCDIQAGSLPDRGHAKLVRKSQADQIKSFWWPTGNQYNWSHELVIDVIGIATAGAAYGRVFLDDTGGAPVRPYELTQSHPPLAVRCTALRVAAERFGWSELAEMLAARSEQWTASEYGEPSNLYRAATGDELVAAGIDAAFDIIRDLNLPKCNPTQMKAASSVLDAAKTPRLGVEILLAAWHANDTMDTDVLASWTTKVVEDATEEESDRNAADLV